MIVCIISLGSFLPTDSRLFHTIPLLYVFMCVCVWTHAPHDMDVKAGGQRLEIGSLLLPYGSPGSNSGWHIWQQAPLPCEPSQSPREGSPCPQPQVCLKTVWHGSLWGFVWYLESWVCLLHPNPLPHAPLGHFISFQWVAQASPDLSIQLPQPPQQC